jgi:hypothetical protein
MSSVSVGQQITLLYDPANPRDTTLSGFGNLWLVPLILGAIGVFFAGFATLFIRATRRS